MSKTDQTVVIVHKPLLDYLTKAFGVFGGVAAGVVLLARERRFTPVALYSHTQIFSGKMA